MVSVRRVVGMLLATRRPSCNAIKEPATFGRWFVRCTISFGVQDFLVGSPNSSARLVGALPAAAGAAGGAKGGGVAGRAGAAAAAGAGAEVGNGCGVGMGTADAAGASASGAARWGKGLPAALNKSGMLPETAFF